VVIQILDTVNGNGLGGGVESCFFTYFLFGTENGDVTEEEHFCLNLYCYNSFILLFKSFIIALLTFSLDF
jgi:hypothetical protein